MLTDKYLESEKPHPVTLEMEKAKGLINIPGSEGVQRLYRHPSGFGISLVNLPMLHPYKFAWEAAVLWKGGITFKTPLANSVKVFETDEETNAWIEKAFAWFDKNARTFMANTRKKK